MLGEKLMHGYDVHEAIYLNGEIRVPWIKGSGPGAVLIFPYSKNVQYVRKSSFLLPYKFEKK